MLISGKRTTAVQIRKLVDTGLMAKVNPEIKSHRATVYKKMGENKMAFRNRRTKTFAERYGDYAKSTIRLSEDGIVYEVLLDKCIKLMDQLFGSEKYAEPTYEANMRIFFEELNAEFRKKDKERLAGGCGSGKSFERYFDKPIKAIADEEEPVSIEDEKKCIHIIKDMEVFLNTKLLIAQEESLYKKNEYIHSLLLPLIDIMIKSDLFYYISPTTKTLGYQCYQNQMRMIKNNIDILFRNEKTENYELWKEILEPLRKIIGDGEEDESYPEGDFPGIISKVWLDANPVLAYFDCVYDIAEKDYQLYESINAGKYGKVHFDFKIGKDESEVRENIEKRAKFFKEKKIRNKSKDDFEKEKEVFFEEFKKAYKNIVKQYMNIDSI